MTQPGEPHLPLDGRTAGCCCAGVGTDDHWTVATSARSEVHLCRAGTGAVVVLKFSRDRDALARQARAIHTWSELPAVVDLLGYLPDAGAMLLAYVESNQGRLPDLTDMATVLESMLSADTAATDFPPLVQRIEESFASTAVALDAEVRQEFRGLDEALHEQRERAIGLAREPGIFGLVHGDLHHGNVLIRKAAHADLPVVIDPMPHAGDRTFDAIDSAVYRTTSRSQLSANVLRLCRLVPGLDSDRLQQWCASCSVVIGLSRLRTSPGDRSAHFLLKLAIDL